MGRVKSSKMWSAKSLTGALLLLVFLGGCAAPGPQATLPNGRWAGEGVFVYEQWKADAPAAQGSISRGYHTTLNIRPGELDGRRVVLLDIESAHGGIPDVGEKTVIKAALVEAKRVFPATVLYRLVGLSVNPKPHEALSLDEHGPPYAASCMTSGNATVFQINYGEGFVDVFRFQGRELEKTGSLSQKEAGMIHWAERLIRQD